MMTTSNQITKTGFLIATHYRLRRSAVGLNRAITGKTAQTLALFMALALLPFLIPGMERYRVLLPDKILSLLKPSPTPASIAISPANPPIRSPITGSQNRAESDNAVVEEDE